MNDGLGGADGPPQEWREIMESVAAGWLLGELTAGDVPEAAVVPLENPALHDHAPFRECLTDVREVDGLTVGVRAGTPLLVTRPAFTAPSVAMLVAVLARAGVRTVVGVGFCGGFADAMECGDLLVPEGAVRDEGASGHYVPAGYPAVADRGLTQRLLAAAGTSGTHGGLVWTTDAPLLETSAAVESWAALGVAGVDMESAALYAVGRALGLRTATLLVVSDRPRRGARTDLSALRDGLRRACRVATAALSS